MVTFDNMEIDIDSIKDLPPYVLYGSGLVVLGVILVVVGLLML
jgi:hypothetical protein